MRTHFAPLLLLVAVVGSVAGPLGYQQARQEWLEKRYLNYTESPPQDFLSLDVPDIQTAGTLAAHRRGRRDAEMTPEPRILLPEHRGMLHGYGRGALLAGEPQLGLALALIRHQTGQPVTLHLAEYERDEERAYISGHQDETMRRLDAGQYRGRARLAWQAGEALMPYTCPSRESQRLELECRSTGWYRTDATPSDGLPSNDEFVHVRAILNVDDDGRVLSVQFDSADVGGNRVAASALPTPLLRRLDGMVSTTRYRPLPPAYRGMSLRSALRDAVWVWPER